MHNVLTATIKMECSQYRGFPELLMAHYLPYQQPHPFFAACSASGHKICLGRFNLCVVWVYRIEESKPVCMYLCRVWQQHTLDWYSFNLITKHDFVQYDFHSSSRKGGAEPGILDWSYHCRTVVQQ